MPPLSCSHQYCAWPHIPKTTLFIAVRPKHHGLAVVAHPLTRLEWKVFFFRSCLLPQKACPMHQDRFLSVAHFHSPRAGSRSSGFKIGSPYTLQRKSYCLQLLQRQFWVTPGNNSKFGSEQTNFQLWRSSNHTHQETAYAPLFYAAFLALILNADTYQAILAQPLMPFPS